MQEVTSSILVGSILLRGHTFVWPLRSNKPNDMYYVYILKSLKDDTRYYIGFTADIQKRLIEHNLDENLYSKRYSPWKTETYIAFQDKKIALQFEKYLKVGSGHAFLKKRLLPSRITS